ncbi:hypothetical protein FBZ93_12367 [Bradyrhizobium macuxiense]|uniref:Uncharacterized protein n=1 Tax=Bradyrhizobium macuxiense TaxID=1755647 RepID=A0A560KV59_9BRAD|nr:hypothetical protein FBZ93_12367 [Bradyrhizobium macuxiense]
MFLNGKIRPATPRSEATVRTVTTGDIAELVATTNVAPCSCFAVVSESWIQWRGSAPERANRTEKLELSLQSITATENLQRKSLISLIYFVPPGLYVVGRIEEFGTIRLAQIASSRMIYAPIGSKIAPSDSQCTRGCVCTGHPHSAHQSEGQRSAIRDEPFCVSSRNPGFWENGDEVLFARLCGRHCSGSNWGRGFKPRAGAGATGLCNDGRAPLVGRAKRLGLRAPPTPRQWAVFARRLHRSARSPVRARDYGAPSPS